jgi:hypothetical protein
MQRQSHDPTSVVQMATLTALAVRRRFRACGFVVDLDDVAQEAALHVVETMAKKQLDPSKNVRGYLYRTAARRAGVKASLALAAVRIPVNMSPRAREFQHRVQIADHGPRRRSDGGVMLLSGGDTPDARLDGWERARRRAAARVRLRRALEPHLAALDRRERRAIETHLGWDGAPVEPEDVSWLIGIPRKALAGLVRRLGAAVRQDDGARAARRVINQTTEDR